MVSRLEDLSAIQVAIKEVNEIKLKKEILDLPVSHLYRKWHPNKFFEDNILFEAMEEKVSDTFQKFPCGLRGKIPISVVIFYLLKSLRWAKFHEEKFDLPFDYSYYFLRSSFFTSKGMINEEMVVREMVKDIEISSSLRFCIACYYCLSDMIPSLWEQLPEDKSPKIEKGKYKHSLGRVGDHEMVHLWSHYLLGEGKKILVGEDKISFSWFKFKASLKIDNDVAFKNCFEQLNRLEKKKAVIFSTNTLYENLCDKTPHFYSLFQFQPCIDILMFLLYHLDEEQLNLILQPQRLLYLVLYHLLSWQYHHLFLDTVKRFWKTGLVSQFGFYFLLHRIVSLMKDQLSCKFSDYHHILNEFWTQSPSSWKRKFFYFECADDYEDLSLMFTDDEIKDFAIFQGQFHGFENSLVIYELFKSSSSTIKDEEIIRLILGSATPSEKSKIAEFQGKIIFYSTLKSNNMMPIELFIECCIPREKVKNFQKDLLYSMILRNIFWDLILNGKLNQLQKILNWASLCGEEVKEFLQYLFSFYVTPKQILSYNSNQLKCIDKCLEWSLSPDEIKETKNRFVLNKGEIAKLKYFLKDFHNIYQFLL